MQSSRPCNVHMCCICCVESLSTRLCTIHRHHALLLATLTASLMSCRHPWARQRCSAGCPWRSAAAQPFPGSRHRRPTQSGSSRCGPSSQHSRRPSSCRRRRWPSAACRCSTALLLPPAASMQEEHVVRSGRQCVGQSVSKHSRRAAGDALRVMSRANRMSRMAEVRHAAAQCCFAGQCGNSCGRNDGRNIAVAPQRARRGELKRQWRCDVQCTTISFFCLFKRRALSVMLLAPSADSSANQNIRGSFGNLLVGVKLATNCGVKRSARTARSGRENVH